MLCATSATARVRSQLRAGEMGRSNLETLADARTGPAEVVPSRPHRIAIACFLGVVLIAGAWARPKGQAALAGSDEGAADRVLNEKGTRGSPPPSVRAQVAGSLHNSFTGNLWLT